MNQSPFAIRGVIEGFYGVFYTFPERNDLIRFIGQHGYNLYIYSSKNDRQHRTRWWEPYPNKVMDAFAETVQVCRQSGVDFCYAISPGVSMSYSSVEDFQQVIAKLYDFYKIGVRTFSVLLDDINPSLRSEIDRARYHSYAEAHYEFCNRVHAQLLAFDPDCTLSMCPTDYHGKEPFSAYIHELGKGLHPAIDIFYTGPEVCSPRITVEDMEAFGRAAGRKAILWDNYPVNDLKMQPEMHIGPIENRDAALAVAVRGVVVNPMNQAEASKIPLLTYAGYLADPAGYDAHSSWEKALGEVGGDDVLPVLITFAENSLHSCLRIKGAEKLEGLVQSCLAALEAGAAPSGSPEFLALEAYLAQIDEACYALRYRMDNLALRNNLLPWIEVLEFWQSAGRSALDVLVAIERGFQFDRAYRLMGESLNQAKNHYKQMTGSVLVPLISFVTERIEEFKVAAQ